MDAENPLLYFFSDMGSIRMDPIAEVDAAAEPVILAKAMHASMDA